jgi:type VI secretion system protein ImpH
MGCDTRMPADDLTWIARLERAPDRFDFHVALRRFEASFPDRPRLGEAGRPADEPVRLGQHVSAAFQPAAITGFAPGREGAPARLSVGFFGLLGPRGPLPGHLTEYASDRARHAGDSTLSAFLDVFHHRMLLLLHRAWAQAQPTAAMDRAGDDAFRGYVAALLGLGLESLRDRDAWPDHAKVFYAPRLRPGPRNAEGLRAVVADALGFAATVESWVGEWLPLPEPSRCRLGPGGHQNALHKTATIGRRAWSRGHRIRIVLGPLTGKELGRMLPGSDAIGALTAIVRLYTNDEWAWDAVLRIADDAVEPARLRRGARLGWTARIGAPLAPRTDLVLDPTTGRVSRERAARPGGFFANGEASPTGRNAEAR